MTPFFALFLAFTLAPILYATGLSLFSESSGGGLGFGERETRFVGIENYLTALGDAAFLRGFAIIGIYCVFYIPTLMIGALVTALILDAVVVRARAFFHLSLYIPNIIPGIIAAMIWLYLYTPGISPLVDAWTSIGLTWNLSTDVAAIITVMNTTLWAHLGYNVVLVFAALQAIPRQTIEAAVMDGAGDIMIATRIKVPLISGTITLAVLFTVIGALQLFAEPFLLRSRATSITSTWTPNMFIYNTAFEQHNFGLASAAAVMFAVLIALSSYAVTRMGNVAGERK